MRTMAAGGLRSLLVLSLLLCLAACSSTTFVYNRLDFILPWYLDDYVDLNREQKGQLDEWLKPFFHWHRVEELPRYVLLLGDVERQLDEPMTPEMVGQTFAGIEAAWLRLEDQALDWLFKLGDELSAEQIAEFLAVLQAQQEEYEEEYLGRSEEKYKKDSYNNFLDAFQDYLGRLDKNQRAVLRASSAELMRMDELWLQERADWLVVLDTQLQREPGWQQALRALNAAREDNHSARYREAYVHNLSVIEGAIAAVLNSRSDKQDRRLRNKLNNLVEDFETLIGQADSIQQ